MICTIKIASGSVNKGHDVESNESVSISLSHDHTTVRSWNNIFWIWNPTFLRSSYTFHVSIYICKQWVTFFLQSVFLVRIVHPDWLLCDYLQAFPLIHHSRSEMVKRKKSWILCKELFHGFSSWWTTCFQEHAMRSFSQGKASLSNVRTR